MQSASGALTRKKWAGAACLCACLTLACNDRDRTDPHISQIQQLEDRIAQQGRTLSEKDDLISEQARSIQELRGLSGERQLDKLVHVASVSIDKLSGGYDDDHDGVDEGVVIYLRVVDLDGDVIKAAGSARVSLLDLAKPEGAQTIGRAEWAPDELRKTWYGKFMTYHYTLRVPWATGAKRAEHPAITAYVRFVELLSGRVFEAQQVVEVHGAQPAS